MVIAERELRSRLGRGGERVIRVQDGDIVTPAAWDFIRTHNFAVERLTAAPYREMGRTPIPEAGERRFVDADGNGYAEKPEHLTHLRDNLLVPKTHPRIEFRGRLDSFQARILEAQIVAREEKRGEVAEALEEFLAFARDILASEVAERPLERKTLLGMDWDALRSVSHSPRRHFGVGHLTPDHRMGRLAVALNSLRAQSRETELAAIRAFADASGGTTRPDLVLALNRLSSGVYIVYCRLLGTARGSRGHGD